MTRYPPREHVDETLSSLWEQPVSSLIEIDFVEMPPEARERHAIYCHLVMALVATYWNGNRPDRSRPFETINNTRGPRYIGHNICCVAVAESGAILDFDFNHNELFNSSIEHAEARILRRLFKATKLHESMLSQIDLHQYEHDPDRPVTSGVIKFFKTWSQRFANSQSHYSKALSGVTLYTSLESCAQCSGMMTLGGIKRVVYLQRDPQQRFIGNVLHQIRIDGAPEPYPARLLGPEFEELDSAYEEKGATEPGIIKFLCSEDARAVFEGGLGRFMKAPLQHGEYKPQTAHALTNGEVLTAARRFFDYATNQGRRATPHN